MIKKLLVLALPLALLSCNMHATDTLQKEDAIRKNVLKYASSRLASDGNISLEDKCLADFLNVVMLLELNKHQCNRLQSRVDSIFDDR